MNRVAVALVAWGVCACAGARGGGGSDGAATFRVFYPDTPLTVKVGKRFHTRPVASCRYGNGRDARWTMTGASLEGGELPEGLVIEDGAIGGTPKAPGRWTVTVKFSGVVCAGQPHEPQLVELTITAR